MLKPGDFCSGHQVVRCLGRGATGEVHEVITPGRVRRALKLVATGQAEKAKEAERTLQEGDILASIDHPNVVRFFDAGTHEDHVWLLLELVLGSPLREVIHPAQGLCAVTDILRWLRRVCEGVAAAHAIGAIHRDLTPSNILITTSDDVKVIDFGIASLRHGLVQTTTDQRRGSALYSAPELLRGEKADPRSDIYSVGVVLYEALAGEPPTGLRPLSTFQVVEWHLSKPPRPLRELAPEVSIVLAALVHQCLEKDPARRPQSMPALAHALGSELHALLTPLRRAARNVPRPNLPLAAAITVPMPAVEGPSHPMEPVEPAFAPPPASQRRPRSGTIPMAVFANDDGGERAAWLPPPSPRPGPAATPHASPPALAPPPAVVQHHVSSPGERRSTSAPVESSARPASRAPARNVALVLVSAAVAIAMAATWALFTIAPLAHPSGGGALGVGATPSASASAPPAWSAAVSASARGAPPPAGPRAAPYDLRGRAR